MIGNILWRLFDNLVLLQMGSTYMVRFKDFAMASEGKNVVEINEWRIEQQEEWNRLSTTVSSGLVNGLKQNSQFAPKAGLTCYDASRNPGHRRTHS